MIKELENIGLNDKQAAAVNKYIGKIEREAAAAHDKIIIEYAVKYALDKEDVFSRDAVTAMINFENIKVENGQVKGLEKEIRRVKESCRFLFRPKDMPVAVMATGGGEPSGTELMRSVMGLS